MIFLFLTNEKSELLLESYFYLDFASDLQAVVHNRLKMFALNTEVAFSEIDANDNNAKILVNFIVFSYEGKLASPRHLIGLLLIKSVPQDLNLDINEVGVSFTKGCYPGQEVVARVHYLGKPKRSFAG
jgi:folate-binding protein YgfZ